MGALGFRARESSKTHLSLHKKRKQTQVSNQGFPIGALGKVLAFQDAHNISQIIVESAICEVNLGAAAVDVCSTTLSATKQSLLFATFFSMGSLGFRAKQSSNTHTLCTKSKNKGENPVFPAGRWDLEKWKVASLLVATHSGCSISIDIAGIEFYGTCGQDRATYYQPSTKLECGISTDVAGIE